MLAGFFSYKLAVLGRQGLAVYQEVYAPTGDTGLESSLSLNKRELKNVLHLRLISLDKRIVEVQKSICPCPVSAPASTCHVQLPRVAEIPRPVQPVVLEKRLHHEAGGVSKSGAGLALFKASRAVQIIGQMAMVNLCESCWSQLQLLVFNMMHTAMCYSIMSLLGPAHLSTSSFIQGRRSEILLSLLLYP